MFSLPMHANGPKRPKFSFLPSERKRSVLAACSSLAVGKWSAGGWQSVRDQQTRNATVEPAAVQCVVYTVQYSLIPQVGINTTAAWVWLRNMVCACR